MKKDKHTVDVELAILADDVIGFISANNLFAHMHDKQLMQIVKLIYAELLKRDNLTT